LASLSPSLSAKSCRKFEMLMDLALSKCYPLQAL